MTVHIGWVIAAALAGFIFGVLIMALMPVASRADDDSASILGLLVEDEDATDKLEQPFWDAAVKAMAAKLDAEIMGDKRGER